MEDEDFDLPPTPSRRRRLGRSSPRKSHKTVSEARAPQVDGSDGMTTNGRRRAPDYGRLRPGFNPGVLYIQSGRA